MVVLTVLASEIYVGQLRSTMPSSVRRCETFDAAATPQLHGSEAAMRALLLLVYPYDSRIRKRRHSCDHMV